MELLEGGGRIEDEEVQERKSAKKT